MSVLLGVQPFFGLANLGIGKCLGPGIELVIRQGAQNNAGALRSRWSCWHQLNIRCCWFCLRLCAYRRRGRHGFGAVLTGQDQAPFLPFDLDCVSPPVRETLANRVALGSALQPERLLGRHGDRFVAGVVGFGHMFWCSAVGSAFVIDRRMSPSRGSS